MSYERDGDSALGKNLSVYDNSKSDKSELLCEICGGSGYTLVDVDGQLLCPEHACEKHSESVIVDWTPDDIEPST